MKPFKINRSSWHYKFNTKFLPTDTDHRWELSNSNFCAYWRATTLRAIVALFFVSCFALVLLIVLLSVGFLIYNSPITLFTIIMGIIAAMGIIAFTLYLEERKKKASNSNKPESLLLQKYRAHKEKICPLVTFED